MGREMAQEVRHTALTDHQISAARPAWKEMLNDPHVAYELDRLEDMFPTDDLGPLRAATEPLAGYCRARNFAFARLYGRFLGGWIARAVCVRYFARQGSTWNVTNDILNRLDFGPHKTERLTPDNALGLNGDGAVVSAEQATARDYMDLRAYFRSLKPAGKPGPKPGGERPKRSGRKPIDRAKASQALAFHKAGKTDLDIADALNLWRDGETRYDNKAVGRVRQRARAMWLAGERYERQTL